MKTLLNWTELIVTIRRYLASIQFTEFRPVKTVYVALFCQRPVSPAPPHPHPHPTPTHTDFFSAPTHWHEQFKPQPFPRLKLTDEQDQNTKKVVVFKIAYFNYKQQNTFFPATDKLITEQQMKWNLICLAFSWWTNFKQGTCSSSKISL